MTYRRHLASDIALDLVIGLFLLCVMPQVDHLLRCWHRRPAQAEGVRNAIAFIEGGGSHQDLVDYLCWEVVDVHSSARGEATSKEREMLGNWGALLVKLKIELGSKWSVNKGMSHLLRYIVGMGRK